MLGARPKPEAIQHAFSLSRALLSQAIRSTSREGQASAIEAHDKIVRLQAQAPTMNFDPGLLLNELAALLAQVGTASENAHA